MMQAMHDAATSFDAHSKSITSSTVQLSLKDYKSLSSAGAQLRLV